MASPTIPETLQLALRHHQAGRLPEAEALYRTILDRDPGTVGALHGLGILALQAGRTEVATEFLRQAAARAPNDPAIHSNLGEAYRQVHRLAEAVASFRRALALRPDFPNALGNLGLALAADRQHDEAIACLRKAIALKPDFAAAHSNLGNILKDRGQLEDAVACFRQALVLQPQLAEAHNNLGLVLNDQGRPDEALACFRQALALNPKSTDAHNNLGLFFMDRGRHEDAITCFEQALALDHDFAEAHNNIGNVRINQSRFDEAAAHFRQALALKPDYAVARNNLGLAFLHCRRLDDAIANFRQAHAHLPDRPDIQSNVILALQYRSDREGEKIEAELRHWNELYARPHARTVPPQPHDRSPDRRLRIGYVSGDFRFHSVAFFLLPFLQAHDRGQLHVTCYSANPRSDEVTARFQSCTDAWRNLFRLSYEDAVRRIREDNIDVLVDLSGHTAGNRLPIFARKPAPIQVSYLGYPGSTGLETIDYRLSDPLADPPGATAEFSSEELVRLPDTAWCFGALSGHPPVNELPALRHGRVTFGCFNNFSKFTDEMLRLWARVLHSVPGSRLAVKNHAVSNRSVALALHAFFAELGISSDRVEIIPYQASAHDHLQSYGRLDLALDTFPYHGTTTTCEALWMGVPVVTLAGKRHASRVGVSLLTNAGLPEFVAPSPDAYVETAVAAAGDWRRLAEWRASLRERMQRSPLMNAPRFARNLEAAYRTMWHRWCLRPAVPRPFHQGESAGHV